MAWQKTTVLLKKRLNQHGLGGILAATRVCEKARSLYPDLFEPVSLKNGCLHLEIEKKNQLALLMIQGKLLQDLQQFTYQEQLPVVERIKLTIIKK